MSRRGIGYVETTFNLPEKYIYAGRVYGSGISLGLTNGTTNYGLAGSNGAIFGGITGAYGQNVGGSAGGGNWSPTNTKYGVTTDASKSGIIVEKDTQLFYVIKY